MHVSSPFRVAVIGAGPSGLVTLKYLKSASTPERPIEVKVFESESKVGGTFRYRAYENAELVSSRQLTAFTDFRIPTKTGDHVSLPAYCQYLEDYATHFELWDHISFDTTVVKIRRGPGGVGHVVHYVKKPSMARTDSGLEREGNGDARANAEHEERYACDAVAICSGLHVEPNIPQIPGIEQFYQNGGKSIHSSEYKTRSQVAGKKVLVLGCGETGMDVSYESIQAGATEVTMCHRNGFLSFPKVLNDFDVFGVTFDGQLPIDGIITNLFENAYIHPWVKLRPLSLWTIITQILNQKGTQAGCSQWVGELPANRLGRAYTFLNKSTKAMPYINRPFKKPYPTESIARYHDPPEAQNDSRIIYLRSFPERFDEDGKVVFMKSERKEAKMWEGRECKPDLVVFATGYRQGFGILEEGVYGTAEEADVRGVWKTGDESVAFIGFVRPGVGAIPPISEMQAMLWTLKLLNRLPPLPEATHYHLLHSPTSRIQYGVDYSSYVYQLATDMEATPSPLQLLRLYGFKVALSYCMGAAFPAYFRLVGPWMWEGAQELARGELWDTIRRRGPVGNLMMGVIPILFYGVVNSLCYLVEIVYNAGMGVVGGGKEKMGKMDGLKKTM
ncbi:hypothetical protein HK097_007842 [Rhizophlyctis rosea]|uniref:Flavin-containing monooxygenase n=1 Tax=Rhizophlyctis rosea TaxID=64517 RepID=A0AAD5SE57_9FUNG|nr:hypothetical protein HK097_007842 [Rhizophlyctis rosea]